MLPADTLKRIAAMAVNAGPRAIELPQEPAGVYGLVSSDGYVQIVNAKPAPLDNHADDISTLCRVAREFAGKEVAEGAGITEIWYCRGRITAVANGKKPEGDTCTLTLSDSPQLSLLRHWDSAGGATLSQAELILLLRTTFYSVAPNDLLPAIRKVKATRANEINQQIENGKVSMSRSTVAEMTGAAAVPEMVTFWVPMFGQAAMQDTQPIKIVIDQQPEQERFKLIVIPGEIESAYAKAEEGIGKRIAKELDSLGVENIPVYRGRP